MRDYSLRLISDEHYERIDLNLHPAGEEWPLSYFLEPTQARVHARWAYSAQIVCSRTGAVRNLDVQVNHYSIDSFYFPKTGHVYFSGKDRPAPIFSDSFGLARLTLRFIDDEGYKVLHSDYVHVFAPNGDEFFSVNAMGSYIASHSQMLFYGTRADYIASSRQQQTGSVSLEDKIRFLKSTATVLERAWRLIRVNPRHSSMSGRTGTAESLSASVRYLITHPEALKPTSTNNGILIGGQRYVPDLSKFDNGIPTTDVQENRDTLSFLRAICMDIESMIPELDKLMALLPMKQHSDEDDIDSASFMIGATRYSLESTRADLGDLLTEYRHLHEVYAQAIPAREYEMSTPPGGTPAFLRLPGYHQVFDSIHRWFALRNVTVRDVRFVRTFLQITETYEVYVLTKLAQFFIEWGFELTSSRQIVYEFDTLSLYKNTEINNVFHFQKDDLTITLYYQPVLYDPSSPQAVQTGLVRSTSLSVPVRGTGEPSHGRYYTPDYVFRLSSPRWKGSRYIIGDAKYTSAGNVRAFKMYPLIFKYLFSLSPLHPDDQISGLYIFNGKCESAANRFELIQSIYDLASNPHQIFPQTEIISLYEYPGTRQSDQFDVLSRLFSIQIEKARSDYELPVSRQDQTPEESTPFERDLDPDFRSATGQNPNSHLDSEEDCAVFAEGMSLLPALLEQSLFDSFH